MTLMGAEWQKPAGRGEFRGALDVTLDLPLASIGTRGLAYLLDFLIIVIIFMFVVIAGLFAAAGLPGGQGIIAAAVVIAYFVIQWGYFFLCEWLMDGQTPGKRYLNLRVVTTEGGRLGPVPAFVRNALRLVDFLPSAYGIGTITLLMSRNAQRIGDLAAGTLVVIDARLPPATASPRVPPGMTADDVALVEGYFDRIPYLEEDRLVHLASSLLNLLRERYPERFPASHSDYRADVELERMFPDTSTQTAADQPGEPS